MYKNKKCLIRWFSGPQMILLTFLNLVQDIIVHNFLGNLLLLKFKNLKIRLCDTFIFKIVNNTKLTHQSH